MSRLLFPKNHCMICNSLLDINYLCGNDYCHREFGYCYRGIYSEFSLFKTLWGKEDRTKYTVEYYRQDNYFHKTVVRSAAHKTYGQTIVKLDRPFDFNKYSAREIVERIDRLIVFK